MISDKNHAWSFHKVFPRIDRHDVTLKFGNIGSVVLENHPGFTKERNYSTCVSGFLTVLKLIYLPFLLQMTPTTAELNEGKKEMAVLTIDCVVNPLSVISFISVAINWNCTRWCSYWQNKQYVISSGVVGYCANAPWKQLRLDLSLMRFSTSICDLWQMTAWYSTS